MLTIQKKRRKWQGNVIWNAICLIKKMKKNAHNYFWRFIPFVLLFDAEQKWLASFICSPPPFFVFIVNATFVGFCILFFFVLDWSKTKLFNSMTKCARTFRTTQCCMNLNSLHSSYLPMCVPMAFNWVGQTMDGSSWFNNDPCNVYIHRLQSVN